MRRVDDLNKLTSHLIIGIYATKSFASPTCAGKTHISKTGLVGMMRRLFSIRMAVIEIRKNVAKACNVLLSNNKFMGCDAVRSCSTFVEI